MRASDRGNAVAERIDGQFRHSKHIQRERGESKFSSESTDAARKSAKCNAVTADRQWLGRVSSRNSAERTAPLAIKCFSVSFLAGCTCPPFHFLELLRRSRARRASSRAGSTKLESRRRSGTRDRRIHTPMARTTST